MCIHGDKSQPERDWVLNGMSVSLVVKCCFCFSCVVSYDFLLVVLSKFCLLRLSPIPF